MDWSNERYVRLYTRDTVTWKLFDWQARSVLMHLLRKVDRSGVLDVGDDGIEGAAAVLELPLGLVEAGMPQLIARGTVVSIAGRYVLPNFLEAQEAPQSDAMRAREHRARRRAEALRDVTNRDGDVTNRDGDVTNRDRSSRDPLNPVETSLQPSEPAFQAEPQKKRALSAAPLPDDWESPAGARSDENQTRLAMMVGPEGVRVAFEKFRNHMRSTGRLSADWVAEWDTWLLREIEHEERRQANAETTTRRRQRRQQART
jgi:hypothetical protein